MKVRIPILCTRVPVPESSAETFSVYPLFIPEVDASRPELQRAVDSATTAIRRSLSDAGAQARHDELARYLFSPELKVHDLKLRLKLRRRNPEIRVLVAAFSVGSARYAIIVWHEIMFEVQGNEDLAERATEVLSAFYRELETHDDDVHVESWAAEGTAWLSDIEVAFEPPQSFQAKAAPDLAALGSFETMDGAQELSAVGRNVTALYPDNLRRAVLRDAEVAEVKRLLDLKDRRPLLLVGRSGVGKTTLLHEVIRAQVAQRGHVSVRENVWLVSPQRLISGMMFVGQWESRLHAILGECRHRDHILYVDDLVGLFRAGITTSSRISVGHVLKPHLERREVRLIAEITADAFQALQEIDRSFADLFQVVPVDELGERRNVSALLHTQRALEQRHEVRFTPEALPTALDLTSRYRREIANPGKTAGFLEDLAIHHRKGHVAPRQVLNRFAARTGLNVELVDDSVTLSRDQIKQAFSRRIVGQQRAIEAMADIVQIAKARLNDPGAPLGSCLLLGPTGVGKTECAKALAQHLFNDESRLLRFDMNEYPEAWSVSRLAGTLNEPEGLLTSAVRRQPFSVILLDEIEKAHPSAFDLLLQVLGEGRLTDALGRTADFSNCIVILTSNLGAAEAEGGIGFAGHETAGDEAYIQAARRFFRPEFFNRLDHIVPFARLTRQQTGQIADMLLREILSRDGLARRRCVLHVEPAAMERIVDAGFDPALGARAIRRELERRIVQPLSARLASVRADAPALVSLLADHDRIVVGTRVLETADMPAAAAARMADADPDTAFDAMDRLLNRVDAVLPELQPSESLGAQEVSPRHRRYFALRELAGQLDDAIERLLDWREAGKHKAELEEAGATTLIAARPARVTDPEFVRFAPEKWNELRSGAELRALLLEKGGGHDEPELTTRLRRLLALAGLIECAATTPAPESGDDRVIIYMRALNDAASGTLTRVRQILGRLLGRRFELGFERLLDGDGDPQDRFAAVEVSGYLATPLASLCAGTYVGVRSDGVFPVVVGCVPAGTEPADETARRIRDNREDWLQAIVDETAGAVPPVVQVMFEEGQVLDVRNGLLSRELPSPALLGTWFGGLLPLKAGDA